MWMISKMNKYVMILIVVVFVCMFIGAVIKEREMLGCQNSVKAIIFNSPPCDNQTSPATQSQSITRIVHWRRAFILSSIFIVPFCLFNELSFVITCTGLLLQTSLLYFSYNFYDYHVYNYLCKS